MKMEYKKVALSENVEEMFIGPFGSSLKNECFVDEEQAYCMVYEQKHAIQKTMNVETRYVDEKKYKELKRFNVKGGDIIVSCRGTIGETFVVPEDAPLGIMHPSIMKIRLKDGVYDKYYFNSLLKMRLKKHEAEANGSGIKMAISATELGKELFPVPTLDEQKQIKNVLSGIENLICKRKEELRLLDDLIKARFVEMFGDPVKNPKGYYVDSLQNLIIKGYITYHLDGNHGGDYPRSEEFVESGVPYIGANCISGSEINFKMAKYLTEDRTSKLRKGIAQNEDVLFAHNATVGPVVVLHTDEEKVILSTSLTAFRCNQEFIKPNYLKGYMLSDGFVNQYINEMKQTTRNQVPITLQKKYMFIVPPVEEQNEFEQFVTQVDKSKVAVQKALDEAQLLFDSLMQKYFG